MQHTQKMYDRRFGEDIEFRDEMYKVLCKDFFQKYIPSNSVILDVACGYCEFINNIKAQIKFGLDLNKDSRKYANSKVRVFIDSCTEMRKVYKDMIDVVYVSNLFEHLTKEDIVKTLKQIHRVLHKGGRLLILQPNIRYCYNEYWNFYDHITPLDDISLVEILELNGFEIIESRPKFLPYSTKSWLPNSIFLLKIYLKFPILHKIFGKQAFIYAKKKN